MTVLPHHLRTAPEVLPGSVSMHHSPGQHGAGSPTALASTADRPTGGRARRRAGALAALLLAGTALLNVGVTPASAGVRAGEDVFEFGASSFHGSPETSRGDAVVDLASTPDGDGYWVLSEDGGVFSHGDADFHGSAAELPLNRPLVELVADPKERGYWSVAADGGVFAFGAPFLGSMAGRPLSHPIVGGAATTTGNGYWLVASDGGIFSFGDAHFLGSLSGRHLNRPIVGMAADPDGRGYWFVAADGAVFSFDAAFLGAATGHVSPADEAVGMAATDDGYWIASERGGVFSFGPVPFAGAGTDGNRPIVGLDAHPDGGGYWLAAGPPPPPPPPPPPAAAPARTASVSGGVLQTLRACESGGNYSAVSSSGAYRGAYQFSRSTWNSVAARWNPSLVGVDPARASAAAQDSMASALFSEQGRSPWPHCGRRL